MIFYLLNYSKKLKMNPESASLIEFKPFLVSDTAKINDIQLYHVKIMESSDIQSFSFYFRYNTMLDIHNKVKSKNSYPQNAIFPPKKRCGFHRSINRRKAFQTFFDSFIPSKNHDITEIRPSVHTANSYIPSKSSLISLFLETIGLRSIYPLDFSDINCYKPIEAPFKIADEEKKKKRY